MRNIILSACIGLLACSANDPTKPSPSESSALTTGAQNGKPPIYLALGDSISMGFNPFIVAHNAQAYVGFPEYLHELIDIPHTNAGCYGETTGSFLDPTAPDRGCRDLKEAGLIRAGYTGTQMEFMTGFIQSHPRLELITIELGNNDLLRVVVDECRLDPTCIAVTLPGTFQTMATNLGTIFATIRALGYEGQIVVPLYYDPFPIVSPAWTDLLTINNGILAQVAGSFKNTQVVDVRTAFAAASASYGGDPCAAGLLIPLTGMNEWVTSAPGAQCDAHPTPAGAELIARTIAPVVPPHGD
ncbi:MAG TPA: SGNH/GDSL hydrolase family protein [Polyangiaceae bacterium]|nr:SGNH/GDSL hydrolase family protein [Polyangiaceae bacterium]